jgi:hypothetical protein
LSWRHAAWRAESAAAAAQVIFAGDSLIMHGLNPLLFEAAGGPLAENLGAARGPALLTCILVERALNAGSRPHALIFCTKPVVQIGGPEIDARFWSDIVTPREILQIAFLANQGGVIPTLALGRLLPSWRARLEIRSLIQAGLHSQIDQATASNAILWRNWTVNRGSFVAGWNTPYRGGLNPQDVKHLHADRFLVDPANDHALDRMMELADSHTIKLYWLLPPLSPELQRYRDEHGTETAYESFIRAKIARHPSCTVLDARRCGFPNDAFCDPTHLNGRGATALSTMVAHQLRELQTRPPSTRDHWISLDKAPSPLPLPPLWLEDVEHSKPRTNTANRTADRPSA